MNCIKGNQQNGCGVLTDFYYQVGRRKSYWVVVFFFALLGYGFSTFNRTVSIDDLVVGVYVGEGNAMLKATRWGLVLYNRLFHQNQSFTPFVDKFLGVFFFLLAAYVLSTLLYCISGENTVWHYTVFSSVLITFPLIHEIWEYNGANLALTLNLFLCGFSLLCQFINTRWNLKSVLLSGMLLSLPMSSYEASIFTYILVVFIVLYLRYGIYKKETDKWYFWLTDGFAYAIPLVLALCIRLLVGFALIQMNHLSFVANGETGIGWPGISLREGIRIIIQSNRWMYFEESRFSTPIRIFDAFSILFFLATAFWCILKRSVLPGILGVLLYSSIFSQAILQVAPMPYRTAQTVQVFCAFVAYLIVCAPRSHKLIRTCVILAMLILSFRQAVFLNWILALNNQRSDNEAMIVQSIGNRLYSEYDTNKPIIFVGEISLGELIEKQKGSGTVITDVNSLINWSRHAFLHQAMKYYFSYYGYELNIPEQYEYDESVYENIAISLAMKPLEIRDIGSYILVNLGPSDANSVS